MAARETIDELGRLIRAAGANEASLASTRAAFDQAFATYRDEGLPETQAVAYATVMLLLSVMDSDPQGVMADAMRVTVKERPRLPLLTLAVVLEALK